MSHTISQKIINVMAPVAESHTVADVRIGLVYTSVRLDNGNTGVAWTGQKSSGGCGQQPKAGTLVGRPARELLQMLDVTDSPLSKTIGLATANALTADTPRPETVTDEILGRIDIQPSEHVAMVGFFGPLVPRLRQTGCHLDIQELKSDKPGTIAPDEGRSSLAACDVAIITATSIVTDTMDELLADLGNTRAAVILGPSSFMHPEVYAGTSVTHIAGARVRNPSAVERIVSEGGGTKLLKKHMDFETICLNPSNG